jgi:hypothetical protein
MITHFLGIQEAAMRTEIEAEIERVDLEAELQELHAIAERLRVRRELIRNGGTLRTDRAEIVKLNRIAKAVDRRRRALRRQLEQPSLRLVYGNADQFRMI